MKYIKIPNKDEKGFYRIITSEDFEYADPVKYYINAATTSYFCNKKDMVTLKFPSVPPEFFDKPIIEKAITVGQSLMNQIISTPVHDNLFKLLESNSKKEQKKLLKGLSLTSVELISFICNAWTKHGFNFSQYKGHHYPKGFEGEQLPKLAHKEDNKITSIGQTTLTEGQIKNLIDQRSVTVSKFIDKGDKWHCFFLTYKGLKGEERRGLPHLHYISHLWGLTRKNVVEQLKSKSYQLPSTPHIDYVVRH